MTPIDRKQYFANIRAKKRSRGECAQCSKQRLPNRSRCADCLAKVKIYNATAAAKRSQENYLASEKGREKRKHYSPRYPRRVGDQYADWILGIVDPRSLA